MSVQRGISLAPRSWVSWTAPPPCSGEEFLSTVLCAPAEKGRDRNRYLAFLKLKAGCLTGLHHLNKRKQQVYVPKAALILWIDIFCICWRAKQKPLTMSIILSPSSSLQFRFLRRWASSMTTQRQGILRSSGQSARIISKVVITAWNRYAPFITLPWTKRQMSYCTWSSETDLMSECPENK